MKIEDFLEKVLIESGDYKFTVIDLSLIIVTLLGSWLLLRVITKIIKRNTDGKPQFPAGRSNALIQILKYFIYSIALVLCLELAGVNITVLIAGSTALLVGVGLGLQNTFNDFVSGIILLFEGSVQIRDVVEVNGMVGKVLRIGFRTSQLETRENIIMIVPNSKLVSNSLINWSHRHDIVRYSVTVGVHYKSDVNLVKETLLKAVKNQDKVLQKPSPFIRFEDFGESSLDFNLFFYSSEKMLIEDIQSSLRFRIWDEFKAAGIEIPFPQRDLHIRSDFRGEEGMKV